MLEHEQEVVTRLTASFYVGPCDSAGSRCTVTGSLCLPTWAEANSGLELQQRGGEYAAIPPVREPFPGIDWGGARRSRLRDRGGTAAPLRRGACGHVVEILNAVEVAAAGGGGVAVASGFPPPEPMEWAR